MVSTRISNSTGSRPGLWGHFFGFPYATHCQCPDYGGSRCGQGPGSSGVSRVAAPRHCRGYVLGFASCSVEELRVLVG